MSSVYRGPSGLFRLQFWLLQTRPLSFLS